LHLQLLVGGGKNSLSESNESNGYALPVQVLPLPANPGLQAHVNPPMVLVHKPLILSQSWVLVVHSFLSEKGMVFTGFVWLID
jgi:hypothetical protein